jgi:hypothetical protein
MLQIGNTLISLDLFDQQFCCDLSHCHGACCIEGDSGAPLELDEIAELENILPVIWEDLSGKAKEVIERQGVAYADNEGEMVTSIVNGKDCVFTCYNDKGICQCAVEKAWRAGKISFMKPVSCHLYPIRTKKYPSYTAVNYQEWTICSGARLLGKQSGITVYEFLKEPLIRKFGPEWYKELCIAAGMLEEGMI